MRLSTPTALFVAALAFTLEPAAAQQRIPLQDGWELAPETEPGERPESGWRAVRVPSPFEDALGSDFDGVCWYRLRLEAPPGSAGARFRLLFHGAATLASVHADGHEVGGHLGAWTPWHVDISEALADGEARIEVRVDEKVGHNTQGFLPVIQPHFGGLWRSVALCVDQGPVLDREQLHAFADASGPIPLVRIEARYLDGPTPRPVTVAATLHDGASPLVETRIRPVDGAAVPQVFRGLIPASTEVRRWSPDRPHLYRVVFQLRDAATGEVLDECARRVGFRDLVAEGTTIRLNGEPLQLRGMLHWGYSPPHLAPPEDEAFWRRQLEDLKSLGCNMVKACLWMPPEVFYEIADEIGLLVWQEYPTWHPTLTEEFLPELRREYDEFHRYDRSHVSVAIRSLTCETGHSAELSVMRALYERCKELVPQTLVVDDSAWIEWHRIHDFYDDHPYGNNSWWPGKIAQMKAHIGAREAKPLLLGECIAADTWMDIARWDAQVRDFEVRITAHEAIEDPVVEPWWAPWGLQAQRDFEALLERRFGRETRDSLRPVSLAYALRSRKYQIERLRLSFPDAGYTLSVIRDITKCRMGLFDDFGALKWSPADWAWHRDTMIALDLEDDRRGLLPGANRLPVRVTHFGRGALDGTLSLRIPDWQRGAEFAVRLAAGTVSDPLALELDLPEVEVPTRFRLEARLDGSHPAVNHWDLWVHPRPAGVLDPAVRIVERLDRATLDFVEQGGRALLLAGDRKGSLRTAGIWFLKGAPFAPPHPLHAELPADFLIELQSFDLEVGRVIHGEQLIEQVDPVLGFWDTHDIRHVNPWLFAFTTRIGAGRLGATVLNRDTPAGRLVHERLVAQLAGGPEPRSALSAELLEGLRAALSAELIDLAEWQIALDPEDRGLDGGWMREANQGGASWRPIRAGRHWEAQGIEHYDGVGWYRTSLEVPVAWRGEKVTAVFEGVDDSFRLYVNGEEVGRYGDPATGDSVWLVRTTVDLSPHLRYGATNEIVLRVVDHVGAGGIHKPVFVTTGPVDQRSELLH